jgi:hypothetical protein
MADTLKNFQKAVQKLAQDTLRRRLEKQQREREKAAKRKREESQSRADQSCSVPTRKKISLQDYSASEIVTSEKDDCRIRLQQIAKEKQAAATNSPKTGSERIDCAPPQGEHRPCLRADGWEEGTAAVAAPTRAAADLRCKIRSRSTAKEETLLVRHSAKPGEFLCDIIHLSGSALKKHMLPAVEKLRYNRTPVTGVHHVVAAYTSQKPTEPTVCAADCGISGKVKTLDCCPGGKPLVDHLAEALDRPDWEVLKPIVKDMQNRRLPGLDENSWPSVVEVVLGVSTGQEFERAVRWLRQRQQDAVENYSLLLPAVDTESISLLQNERVHNFFGALSVMREQDNADAAYLMAGAGVQFPVLMMYRFMDWQLHIRIEAEHQQAAGKPNRFKFAKCGLPREFDDLMAIMVPGLGQDVNKDVREFLAALKALYGWDGSCKLRNSLELLRLSMMAGSTQPCSLASYCLTWLGTVMAKDWRSSTGDGLMWRPFRRLPTALQAYLLGDIQQVAIMGWLMIVSWLLHVFPEFPMVNRVTGFTPLQFLAYWTENIVVKLLLVSAVDGFLLNAGSYSSRRDLLEYVGIGQGEKFDVLRLCPDWPAFTSQKEPSPEEVSQYFLQVYPVLRRLDPDVFIAVEEIDAAMEHSDDVVVSNSPKSVDEWIDYAPPQGEHRPCSRTDRREEEAAARAVVFVESTAEQPAAEVHPFFLLPHDKLTHTKVKRAVADMKPRTLRDVMREYFRRDMDRAKQLFIKFDRDFLAAKHLFCLKTGNKVIDDLEALLHETGHLNRPSFWNNPYRVVRMAEKHARRVTHLELAAAKAEIRSERAEWVKEQAEKAKEDAARKLILARQQLHEERASSSSASAPSSTAVPESDRPSTLGRPAHKKNKRQRRQAREKANTERPRNQSPAVEQMEEADREEGEGPPPDSFDQLCYQLAPEEQRTVRIVEAPEDATLVPAVITVEDDTLVITVEDSDML